MSGEGVVKLDESITAENVASKVHAMFSQGQSLVNIDANLALNFIKQITAASKAFKYEIGFGKAELLYSAYHWFHGDIEKSLEANSTAQSIFKKHEDLLHLSISDRLLGMIYGELGDYDKCLELYYNALQLQETVSDKRQTATTLNNIASAQMKMGVADQGLISYQKALEILESINTEDPQIVTAKAMICTNMGQAYNSNSDFEKSLHYHQLSLRWSQSIDKSSRLVAQTYYHIGFLYVNQNDASNALPNLQKALEIAESMQNKKLLGDIFSMISKAYRQMEKYDLALSYAIKHKEQIKENDVASISVDILSSHKLFAEIYEGMMDFSQATFHYKKVMDLNEKIQQQDKVIQVRNKNIRHQLEKQKSELQQSNADLQMFASIASHDMRAPLRTISSFMQLLERKNKEKFDAEDKQYIDFAVNGAKHLERMIEDLLAYSKLDKNLGPPKAVDLNEVANIVDYSLKSFVNERNAKLQIGKLPAVLAHQTLMTQLIQNIAANGIKYNRSDVPTVNITDVSEGNEIIVAISDNGIGIPEQQYNKAFKMFSRLHSAAEFEGTGIGLAMCKKIMDYYNGRIWIEKNANGGTTFYIAFPNSKHPKVSTLRF
jgi:signal transduction histidine kinase